MQCKTKLIALWIISQSNGSVSSEIFAIKFVVFESFCEFWKSYAPKFPKTMEIFIAVKKFYWKRNNFNFMTIEIVILCEALFLRPFNLLQAFKSFYR